METIINTVFSIPYLVIGVTIAAILDMLIHFTKSSTRFTFLEIWGCVIFWPLIVLWFFIALLFD